MPKRPMTAIVSSAFGRFASHAFPSPIQRLINRAYVSLMGLDMREFDDPASYPTLNALFTRELKAKRALPDDTRTIISPVDARITQCGRIEYQTVYQIKGMPYRLDTLLGEHHRDAAAALEGGTYANFYLSPKDYHRYHMPATLRIVSATHIPGKLYPVNMPLLKRKYDLFIENERVVLECRDTQGKVHVIVLVGALNVGKMVVVFDERIRTNSDIRTPQHYKYDDITLKRGELLGWFEMGSTLLLFSQQGSATYHVKPDTNVRFSDPIGTMEGNDG